MSARTTEILHLLPKELHVEQGFNPRIDYGDIEELGESIWIHHVRKPLEAFIDENGRVVIDDGHRRNKAIQRNLRVYGKVSQKDTHVPVIIVPERSLSERLASTIISNDGKPFTPIEEAIVFKHLRDKGMEVSAISALCGKSVMHVNDKLILMSSDPTLIEAVKSKKVKQTVGVMTAKALRKADKLEAEAIMEKVSNGDTQGLIDKVKVDSKGRFKILNRHRDLIDKALADLDEAKAGKSANKVNMITGKLDGMRDVLDITDKKWPKLNNGYDARYNKTSS